MADQGQEPSPGATSATSDTSGDPRASLDHLGHALSLHNDSGSTSHMNGPLAGLAVLFDRLRHHEPAAMIGFSALTPSESSPSPR